MSGIMRVSWVGDTIPMHVEYRRKNLSISDTVHWSANHWIGSNNNFIITDRCTCRKTWRELGFFSLLRVSSFLRRQESINLVNRCCTMSCKASGFLPSQEWHNVNIGWYMGVLWRIITAILEIGNYSIVFIRIISLAWIQIFHHLSFTIQSQPIVPKTW